MSDGAPDAAQADAAERDERDQRVLRLGAAGCGRAEIALALGMCPEALDEHEARDAALASALRGAAGLAQGWWETLAREACEAGRFSLAAGTREMRRRHGKAGPGVGGGTAADGGAEAAGRGRAASAARPRVRYLRPCNGMTKLNPDGTCPCGAYHDDEFWRAEHEAWRAESPENAEYPSWDELQNQDDADEEETLDDEQL